MRSVPGLGRKVVCLAMTRPATPGGADGSLRPRAAAAYLAGVLLDLEVIGELGPFGWDLN